MKRNREAFTPPRATLGHFLVSPDERKSKRKLTFDGYQKERDALTAEGSRIQVAHRTDGRNRSNGALFDHRLVQEITQTKTVATWDKSDKKKSVQWLKEHIETLPYQLKFDVELGEESTGVQSALFVPGVSSDNYNNPAAYCSRVKYEFSLLKQAFYQGKPVLAVCGAAWELWRFCHLLSTNLDQKFRLIVDDKKRVKEEKLNIDNKLIVFSNPDEYVQAYDTEREIIEDEILQNPGRYLKKVSGHSYRRMPGLHPESGSVTHNIQMHRIALQHDALFLMAAMQLTDNCQPAVNSVHWQACDERSTPIGVTIGAYSVEDQSIAPYLKKEEGIKWEPEEGAIEAFELSHGAPMIGIQWHPEAYFEKNENKKTQEEQENCEQQRRILQFIAKAGHTYHMKVRLVQEINAIGSGMKNWRNKNLKKLNLIKHQANYLLFASNCHKNGEWLYYPKIKALPQFPLRHDREAEQLALAITLPFVQNRVDKGVVFCKGKGKVTNKDSLRRSSDFFANNFCKQNLLVQSLGVKSE